MKVAVHQPQYLSWIGYFHKIDRADKFVFQDDVQYKHREFQNRNKIKTQKDTLWLTVPVKVRRNRQQLINECEIDNTRNWPNEHLKSITQNYSKAKYFETYAEFLEDFYSQNWDKLIDVNIHFIKYVLQELEIETPIYLESEMRTGGKTGEDRIIEVCKHLRADTYLSGAGGREWMDLEKFDEAGIQVEFQDFHHPVYAQLHGQFVSHLSVIDLMLNEGPNSTSFIKDQHGT